MLLIVIYIFNSIFHLFDVYSQFKQEFIYKIFIYIMLSKIKKKQNKIGKSIK